MSLVVAIRHWPWLDSCFSSASSLELVDLVLGVTEFLEVTGNLALVGWTLLGTGDGLVHARGTADEKLDVGLLGVGEDSLEELLADEALGARPVRWGLVEEVEGAETLGVLLLEVLELALQEDVFLADVAENKRDLGLVVRVLEDGAAELVHGGDASTASNEGNLVVLVGGPGVLGDGALEVESLTGTHVVHVLGHGAVGVALDDEVDVSFGILVADGRVWSDDGLLHLGTLVLGEEGSCKRKKKRRRRLAGCREREEEKEGEGEGEGEQHTGNIQTRRGTLGQVEAELLGVVVDVLDALKLQADEALVAASKGLFARSRLGRDVGRLGLGRGLAVAAALVGLAVRGRGRRLGAAVHVVVATSTGSSGNTTVEEAITSGLCSLGSIAADRLEMVSAGVSVGV